MAPSLRWDVFCRVVDNFGDAGVCWRLARQLASEHGLAVTLWIDDLASLGRFVPGLDPALADQAASPAVRVRRLTDAMTPDPQLPDVVIEGFGCGLPPPYLAAMAAAARPPVWVVLEYLSAEPWIDASHGLPSPHPQLPLTRWFWFPGFTDGSGGLLREARLLATRDAFRSDARAAAAVWRAARFTPDPEALRTTLFCYANPAVPALLDAWAEGDAPVACIVPEGVATAEIDRWSGGALPRPGAPLTRGRLTLAVAPFVDQDAFDRRLWLSDLNFVRGEDSFVRAQWAGQPYVWQPYPQSEDTHLVKMDAFLTRLEASLPEGGRIGHRAFWYAWNAGDPVALADAWPAYLALLPTITALTRAWARLLARRTDLADALVKFCENRL
jgi:uncharacterized repeat protein (TIGR03837 family)